MIKFRNLLLLSSIFTRLVILFFLIQPIYTNINCDEIENEEKKIVIYGIKERYLKGEIVEFVIDNKLNENFSVNIELYEFNDYLRENTDSTSYFPQDWILLVPNILHYFYTTDEHIMPYPPVKIYSISKSKFRWEPKKEYASVFYWEKQKGKFKIKFTFRTMEYSIKQVETFPILIE